MKLDFNAPLTLSMTLLAAATLAVTSAMGGLPRWLVASAPNPADAQYALGLVLYPLAHANVAHLCGNLALLLLLGPVVEERYGSLPLLLWFAITSVVIGLAHTLFFSGGLVGASGLVFFCVMLSSAGALKAGRVPVTLLLVALVYLGQEISSALEPDDVSQMAHVLGGVCGVVAGLFMKRRDGLSGKADVR